MQKIILISVLILLSCNSKKVPSKPTFNSNGIETKDCSIRDAKGHGPYEPLGRVTKRECLQVVSKMCNLKKYKQIHRRKGHFARGKFGEKILIGLCP